MKYALIIGNDTYLYPDFPALAAPARDVEELSQVLGDPAIGAFEIQQLINAPEDKVTRAIERFFRNRQRDDLLLLHFSGHGVIDINGRLHLAATDTNLEELNSSSIPARFVSEQMDATKSSRVILMLDCCHSGSFFEGTRAVGTSVGSQKAFEGTGYGRWVLTATDETQYAWEGESPAGVLQPSIFTRSIVEGLRTGKADMDRDGFISVRDLADYVSKSIATGDKRQTPCLWSYKEHDKVIIAENPAPQLPEGLVSAFSNPFAKVRLAAVRELGGLLRSAANTRLAAVARAELSRIASEDDSRQVCLAASHEIGSEAETTTTWGATAERTRSDEERRRAAEQAQLEEERKQAVEEGRQEEARKLAAEQVRQQQERERQGATEKARLEQQERETTLEKLRHEYEQQRADELTRLKQELERASGEKKVPLGGLPINWKWVLPGAVIVVALVVVVTTTMRTNRGNGSQVETPNPSVSSTSPSSGTTTAPSPSQAITESQKSSGETPTAPSSETPIPPSHGTPKKAPKPTPNGNQPATSSPVFKDQKVADLYRQAIAGDSGAMVDLGHAYAHGQGVDSDYSQAVAWYRKAIDAGNSQGMNNLGYMYKRGLGVVQDHRQAAAWYRKGAEAGNAEAMDNLGAMYRDGLGVDKDYGQAVSWFRKAINAGNADAMTELGRMYETGRGVDKDYAQAVVWYRKAAAAGDALGMSNLGAMYECGCGVDKNRNQAIALYRKAAQLGNQVATANLKRLGESVQ